MPSPDEKGPYFRGQAALSRPHRPSCATVSPRRLASPWGAFVIDRRRIKVPKRHIPAEEVPRSSCVSDEAVSRADLQLERMKCKLRETDEERTVVIWRPIS